MKEPNSYLSSANVKKQGRTAYYKMLESVRRGELIQVRRGIYANIDQLSGNMIDINAIVPDGILPITEYSQQAMIQGLFRRDDDRFIYGWNKLYRKDLLDNLWCGDYPRHQDFDFNFRVFLRARKAVFVNLELYHWVQWSGSKTHQSNTMDLYYKCRTAILYDNWSHLDPDNTDRSGSVSEKPGFFSMPNESEMTGTNSKPAFLSAFRSRKM